MQVDTQEYEYPPYEFEHVERLSLYNPGGFHPIDVGDVIDERFEVSYKLGCGGFGLVWLCFDRHSEKWRALKILTAEHSAGNTNREVKSIEHLRRKSTLEDLQRSHVGVPIEHFYIDGPNGRHLCFVSPVFGRPVSIWRLYQEVEDETMARESTDICRQLAKGVRFLHHHEIVHGDIKPTNILMKLNGFEDLTKDQMRELLGEPEMALIETRSGSDPGPRAPKYCVNALPEYWCEKLITTPEIVIVDFGESFHVASPRESWGTPLTYAAPEVVFRKAATGTSGFNSDVWSLACTMYEIKVGDPLFTSASSPRSLVQDIELFLGPLPDLYLTAWNKEPGENIKRKSPGELVNLADGCKPVAGLVTWELSKLLKQRELTLSGTRCSDVLEAQVVRQLTMPYPYNPEKLEAHPAKEGFFREDAMMLADLLRGMLKYDPHDRMTLNQICRHPWIDDRTRMCAIYEGLIANTLFPDSRRSTAVFIFPVFIFVIVALVYGTPLVRIRLSEIPLRLG